MAGLTAVILCLLLFWQEHSISGSGRFLHLHWLLPFAVFAIPFLPRWWRTLRAGGAGVNPAAADTGAPLPWTTLILLGGMALCLCSGVTMHKWFYFLGWGAPLDPAPWRGHPMRLFLLAAAAIWGLCAWRPRLVAHAPVAVLFVAAALVLANFLRVTGGQALYRDDHPSFLFRMWEFGRTFPRLSNWNPFWNGGEVEQIAVVTGTTALGLPFWPLWKWLPPELVYTPVLALTYLVLVPAITYGALRLADVGRGGSAAGAVLSLGVSQYALLWLLGYGTVCANYCATWVVPVAASLYRIVILGRRERWLGAVLVIAVLAMIQWGPGTLMVCMLGLGVLPHLRRLDASGWRLLLTCAAIVLALHARTLYLLCTASAGTLSFVFAHAVADDRPPLILGTYLIKGLRHLLAHLLQAHPLLVFAGFAGAFFLPGAANGRGRHFFWPMLLGFAFLTGWGHRWLERMEISRMAIPMMHLTILPAAMQLDRLFRLPPTRAALPRALLLALLLVTGINVARLYGNEGRFYFTTFNREIPALTNWIRAQVPEGGRVMFSGPTVHYFWGGHVAPLPYLSGREMMCSDFYAFPPDAAEYNYPPRVFRDGPDDIFRFMQLYNVTHIISYEERRTRTLAEQPERYEQVLVSPDSGGYAIFRVRQDPDLCLEGRAQVHADFNRIDVSLPAPAERIVLKYNWDPRLRVTPPAELFPADVGYGHDFIGLRPNGTRQLSIRY